MNDFKKHIVNEKTSVLSILDKLDKLASDAIVFVVDDYFKLIGSLTDGDIRRGLIKGLSVEDDILNFIQGNPKFLNKNNYDIEQLQQWRKNNYKIIPIVDENQVIIDVINFRIQKSYLPIDAVIMAGGKGTRLRPMTLTVPKPLLKVGGKPIIQYNIERLRSFGVNNITISIKYLGQQLIDYFGEGNDFDVNMNYVEEEEPLGTIGAVGLVENFFNDYVLVMNSDILTNINYEDMFKELVNKDADMIVATTPYEVQIPYGVIETEGDNIIALKEKPTYTYYSNAGIYIFKKEFVNVIPKGDFFNATDLMEQLYTSAKKVIHYPILDYWLDIGKPHDFEKAQNDIKHIKF